MSQNPPSPEKTKDILVCDKDYKFLRKIDDHFANSHIFNVHVTSVYKIDQLIQDLGSSPFHFIIIGPNDFLDQEINDVLSDQKPSQSLIKVIENDKPEVIIKYLYKGINNMVSMDSFLHNFELVIENIIQFGSFIDPLIMASIKPNLTKISQLAIHTSGLKPKAQLVLELLKKGYSYVEIGEELDISLDSVRYYIKTIYKKFNVKSKVNAINKLSILEDQELSLQKKNKSKLFT